MRLLENIQSFDHKLLSLCFNSKIRLKHYAYHISKSGDGYLYVILPLLYFLVNPELGKGFLKLVIIAFVIERSIYFVLKNKLKRRRPPQVIPGFQSLISASDEFSFPSGHTSGAFLFSTLCTLWFGSIALPLYCWAAVVGLCRVLLGVHFPTDILAGAALGSSLGILSYITIF